MREDVVVVEYDQRLRRYLHLLLTRAGYSVTEVPTFDAAAEHLRDRIRPAVVVAGNATPDNRLVGAFFATLASNASPAARHRFLLLTTTPECVPPSLRRLLVDLGAPILRKPVDAVDLLEAVARAADHVHTGEPLLIGPVRSHQRPPAVIATP